MFDHSVRIETLPNGDLRPRIERSHTNNNTLWISLIGFWRWNSQGRPPYGGSYVGHEDKARVQYWYDPYHNHIELDDDGGYRFSIQLDDGPDGDTWWSGRFRLQGWQIEIVEERKEVR